MKKLNFILATLGVLAVTAIVIVSVVMALKANNQDRFSITGDGTVYAKADIANIEVGLRTGTKKTAAEATTDSTNKMNAIIGAVKALGIDEKDIKTSDYALNPVYNYTATKGQELTGYEVTQNVDFEDSRPVQDWRRHRQDY